jgi:hypothetical protein
VGLQDLEVDAHSRSTPGDLAYFKLVLLSRPWHEEKLVGPRAAFFGSAATVSLEPPGERAWQLWSQQRHLLLPPNELKLLVGLSRGLPRYAFEVLDAGDGSINDRWLSASTAARSRARLAMRTARAIHGLGPALLSAIAKGEPPYRASSVASKTTASVLRKLRDVDLIYQPASQQWRVSDPFLERIWAEEWVVEVSPRRDGP